MAKNEINIIDFSYTIFKWRKLILKNFIIVCIIVAVVSLIIPKWYRATTTILPSLEEGNLSGISSILSQSPIKNLGTGLGNISEEAYMFMAILNSRTIMESVASKFNLEKRYRTKNMEETIKILRKRVSSEINEDATLSITVYTKTSFFSLFKKDNEARMLAKDMANFFIDELDKVYRELKTESATNTRIFIEKRYFQNLDDLRKAEESFKTFQEKYGAIALPEQTTVTISAAAEIKAEIITKEIEIDVLKQSISGSHNELKRAENELDALINKYEDFKRKKNFPDLDNTQNDLFLPLEDVPNIGLQYARLFRDIALQEKILELILPQYEEAKIKEANNTPTVQVLDKAIMPILRAKPKRALLVLLSGLLSIILSSLYVFAIEYVNDLKIKKHTHYDKINDIYYTLVDELKRFFLLKKKRRNHQ